MNHKIAYKSKFLKIQLYIVSIQKRFEQRLKHIEVFVPALDKVKTELIRRT